MRECTKVSDEAVAAVAQHGSLESLDVSALPGLGPATIKALATCCKCDCWGMACLAGSLCYI